MKRVLEMARSISSYHIDEHNTSVSKPIAVSGDYNTSVLLQGSLDKGYYGRNNFHYSRFDLSSLPQRQIRLTENSDIHALLPLFNSEAIYSYLIKINEVTYLKRATLEPEDVVNYPVTLRDIGKPMKVFAQPDSYMFTGSMSFVFTA